MYRPDVKWRLVSVLIEELRFQSPSSSDMEARDIIKQLQCADSSPVTLALLVHEMIDGMFEESILDMKSRTSINLVLPAAPQLALLALLARKVDPQVINPEEVPSEEVVQAVLELHRV